MKGKHHIEIRNRRIVFKLDLERNITIIRGDSATGKTTLVDMLANYEALGEKSGVSVSCDKRCRVLTEPDWEERLELMRDSIVFVDEGNAFLTSEEFAGRIQGTDNYYVLITRESLYNLPYSVDEVYELRKAGRYGRLKQTYNRMYRYYGDALDVQRTPLSKMDSVLTEDSNAGYQLFSKISGEKGIDCVAANGKSNIFSVLQALKRQGRAVFTVADGAAFGPEMDKVYQLQQTDPDHVVLYLPESFEWLVLQADLVRDSEIKKILENPADYIECGKYFSWEQYFTSLLIERTNGTYMQYSKSNLAAYYLQDENVEKILSVVENGE